MGNGAHHATIAPRIWRRAALLSALQVLRSYLLNEEFEIVTGHISLTDLKNIRSGPSKLARTSVTAHELSQFKFKVPTHLTGKKNCAAYAISRTEDLQSDVLTTQAAGPTPDIRYLP